MPIMADALRACVTRIFQAAGLPDEDADAVAAHLVDSNLCGHDSHGVLRVDEYLNQLASGELTAKPTIRILSSGPAYLHLDAGRAFGQVVCGQLFDRLAGMAAQSGIACGSVCQAGHVGRLGAWVERVANQGLCGLLSVNDNGVCRVVAPPGGLAARISTNPLAIAVPTETQPLVLDLSTSAVANGKLKAARMAGEKIPVGWVQDAAGGPSTDPAELLKSPPGSLLPFGGEQGYKAFGLGMVLDILISGLSGGFCPPAPAGAVEFNNLLAIVWDPDRFSGRDHIRREAERLMAFVRETPRKAGVDRIRLPGDRSAVLRAERLQTGLVLDRSVCEMLAAHAQRLNIPAPELQQAAG